MSPVFCLLDDKWVINIPFHIPGGLIAVLMALLSKSSRLVTNRTNGRTHGCSMDLLITLTLEEEICVFEAELQ